MLKQFVIRQFMKHMLNFNKPLDEIRQDVQNMKIKQTKKETTCIEKVVINETPCMWVIPEGCDTKQFVIFLHGGGYCLGAYTNTIQRTVDLAETLGISVLMIDYPVAPEHAFPAAIQAVNSIYDNFSKHNKVALLGESSGCGLALNLMVYLREEEKSQPICSLMLTPFLDATYSNESNKLMKNKDPFYVTKPYVVSDYYTSGFNLKEPMISPIYHEVHDLPPILIHTAQYDTLSDDGKKLYYKLLKANGKVSYRMWGKMWHLFHTQYSIIPEGKKAMQECKEFLHQQFEAAR